ncbi:MAG: hypothetical protein SFW64_00105 [Alphaproteobacteria bacterium]|nr:hypothetical protein [Alphaproteobacteria bacterium]
MSKPIQLTALQIAQAHWTPVPDWVRLLAEYSDKHTQAAASRKIGRSASLVNQVLKQKYPGDLQAVQARVETALKIEMVRCPIMGPIAGSECLKHQGVPYNPGNHMAVALFRQCRRCPNACGRKPHG